MFCISNAVFVTSSCLLSLYCQYANSLSQQRRLFRPIILKRNEKVGSVKNRENRGKKKRGAQNIVKEIKQDQEKWLQHVQRMDTNRLPKQTLQYKPKRRKNIGRPRKRWRDQLHLEDQGTGNTSNPSGT